MQGLPQGIDPVDVAVVQPEDGVKSAARLELVRLKERAREREKLTRRCRGGPSDHNVS